MNPDEMPRSRGRVRGWARSRSGRRRAGIAAAASVLVVLVSPLVTSVRVAERAEQANLGFGWPFAWAHQDQSAMDPPLPRTLGLTSPWEHPTSVSVGAFAVSVLAVLVALLLVRLSVSAAAARSRGCRRRQSGSPAPR